MVCICHHLPGVSYRRDGYNPTYCLGDGKGVFLRQRVHGSVTAVRADQNDFVFLTEVSVVADAAWRMLLLFMLVKAAEISLMDVCNESEYKIPKMRSSTSLMLL
jgi:hypothetical protein